MSRLLDLLSICVVVLGFGMSVPQNANRQDFIAALTAKANTGDVTSQMDLAFRYMNGNGLKNDETKAAGWFRKAADKGDPIAQDMLGVDYEFGRPFTQDYVQAFFWYSKAAQQGYAEAQNNLGALYDAGNGVRQDHEQAAVWYQIGRAHV